jgi:N-acyl homoserine lactone hydrolase
LINILRRYLLVVTAFVMPDSESVGLVRDLSDDGSNPDAEAIRVSTNKLLDLVEREKVGLVIFGHDPEQWKGLKKLPEYYE